jgi:hypothetical protein
METITLYRAASDDTIVGCASFAKDIAVAREYLDNPGFGGAKLWKAEVEIDPATALDLYDEHDPMQVIMDRTGLNHPGAIGVDEWVPRISYQLRDAGVEWVRVRESYPQDAETWIFVGSDDPMMEEVA